MIDSSLVGSANTVTKTDIKQLCLTDEWVSCKNILMNIYWI